MLINRIHIDEEYIGIVVEKSYNKSSNYKRTKKFSIFMVIPLSVVFIVSILMLLRLYLYPSSKEMYLIKYFIFYLVFSSIILPYFSLNLIKKKDVLEGLQKKIARAIVLKAVKSRLDGTVLTIEITEDKIFLKNNKEPFLGSGDWSAFSGYTLNGHFYVLQNYQNTYYMIIDQNGFEKEGDKEKFEKILNSKLECIE